MGKQYNKVIKRKRRHAYVQRKDAAQAAAVKVKTAAARPAAKTAKAARAPRAPKTAPVSAAAAPAPAPAPAPVPAES
jgi:hypothetical protein